MSSDEAIHSLILLIDDPVNEHIAAICIFVHSSSSNARVVIAGGVWFIVKITLVVNVTSDPPYYFISNIMEINLVIFCFVG